jgi:hypothetical protein
MEPTEDNLEKNYIHLKSLSDSLYIDMEKLTHDNNKSAGQRARAVLLSIKKLTDKMRKQTLLKMKNIEVKHRSPKSLLTFPIEELDKDPEVKEVDVHEANLIILEKEPESKVELEKEPYAIF